MRMRQFISGGEPVSESLSVDQFIGISHVVIPSGARGKTSFALEVLIL